MSPLSRPKSPLLSSKSSLRFTQYPLSWLYAFWKFSRPHTIIGTSLSVLGVSLVAIANAGLQPLESPLLYSLPGIFLLALFACLCGNVYIVGLNQLEDVEIDRVNKPHLPIASGEFSRQQGWGIVLTCGMLALLVSATQGTFLMGTVWLSLLIGTAYSLPPIRLKRFPFWASFCILSVRGAIVNLGLFLHIRSQIDPSTTAGLSIPANMWALTLFILVFTFAIAIFKDVPDLEGDRRYHITTFTVQLGQRAVFQLARGVLTLCYAGMILSSLWIPQLHAPFVIVTHTVALVTLWSLSQRVNLHDKGTIIRFYQFIWKLFFLEYLLFPIACFIR